MLCIKEGVKPRNRKTWSAEHFCGFKNTKNEEEFALNVQRVFALGKASILRKLAGVESLEEMRSLCEESRLVLTEREWKLFGGYSEGELGLKID